MRRKRESTDNREHIEATGYQEHIEATNCPACGKQARYRKTDEAVLYFQCKGCTTRFQIQNKLPTQAELESQFIDSPVDTGDAPLLRIIDADSDGPLPAPIRTGRSGSQPEQPGPGPGIHHKD